MNHRLTRIATFAVLAAAVCAGGVFAQALPVGYVEHLEPFPTCSASYGTACPLTGTGWTNLTNDAFDWRSFSGQTGSTNTGPTNPNAVDFNPGTAAGHYMYTETSGGSLGSLAVMESPR
ncbi:MAG: hypothetical protein KDB53_14890, partial [Planctomycetes bacterium]|nr:hypothetical protein [Planctomycetota bacterium]